MQAGSDFRLYLQDELLRRCRKNPAYSVRAFAKVLQSDFSTLSKILRGKRPLGPRTISRFGARLGLSPDQVQRFIENGKSKRARGAHSSAELQDRALADYQQLTLDTFQIISDWYHYAILELMKLKSFEPNPKWIAKTLGIKQSQVQIAIERLQRVELLHIQPDGTWVDQSGGRSTTVGNPFTATAFRNLQRQVLEGALEALEEIPMERRDQSSMTIAVHSERLAEAKEKIKAFRREMSDLLTFGPGPDEVYQLSVSLYPLTEIESQKKRNEP